MANNEDERSHVPLIKNAESAHEEGDNHAKLAERENGLATQSLDVKNGKGGSDGVRSADDVGALDGGQGEISTATLLLHLLQEAAGVDVDGINTALLVEYVDKEADPGAFAVLGTARGLLEGRRAGVHRRALLQQADLGFDKLLN